MSDDETSNSKPYYHALDLLRKGGKWLGAARSRIQTMKCRGNGEHVTWGSDDVIEPHMTIGQVEEIAAYAAAAAFTERAEMEEHIAKLRKARLYDNIKADCGRDRAIKVARDLLDLVQKTTLRYEAVAMAAAETLDAMPKDENEAPAAPEAKP